MEKKAQVTIFMIVGILILVVFAFILFISNKTVTTQFETVAAPSLETVPQEFVAIQEYTTNCLYQIAKQGITILGQQGGYITPNSLGDFSQTNPTDSAGVVLGSLLIPYWHYNDVPNGNPNVNLASLQPAMYLDDDFMSIEAQLGRYVNEEIDTCLNGYEAFETRGFAIESGEKSTRARVSDGYVDFTFEMPLQAQRNDATTEMEVFHTVIDVNLKKMYETAVRITQAQQEFKFLENQAIELLNIYSRTDADAFVPFYEVTFTENPDQTVWNSKQLKQKLKSLLLSYVPVLRFHQGEDFYRYEYGGDTGLTNLYQQISDNMVLDLPSQSPENPEVQLSASEQYSNEELIPYAVRFDYLGWDPYFDVNAGQEQIKPSGMYVTSPFSSAAFRFGYQIYRATYDISYPVLVTIQDDASFKGTGFGFNFALESNIINNNPIVQDKVQMPPKIVSTQRSLACNENQRDSEMVRTMVLDSYTHEPLELVNVGLVVPELDFCDMGKTNTEGVLDSKYPLMYGGELEFANDGYLTSRFVINTYDYTDTSGIYGYAVEGIDTEVIELHKEKVITAKVSGLFATKCIIPKVCNKNRDACDDNAPRICFKNGEVISPLLLGSPLHELEASGSKTFKNEYYFSGAIEALTDNQQVTISLERVSGLENDPSTADYSQFVIVQGEETTQLSLVPGLYKASIISDSSDFIFVPIDNRCFYDEDDQGQCDDSPGTQLSNYVLGITTWDTPNSYFRVTGEDLYNSDTIEFIALGYDMLDVAEIVESVDENGDTIEISGLVTEDIGVVSSLSEISTQDNIRRLLEPRWSSTNIEDEQGATQ
jgi:hypothetical protein